MMNINIFFAGLTSTLTVDLVENPIESLDDLLAKRAKYQIVTYAGYKKFHRKFLCNFRDWIIAGSVDLAYFQDADEDHNKLAFEVHEKMIKPDPERAVFEGAEKVYGENFSFYVKLKLFYSH